MDLPLDVKLVIASFDIDVWIRLSYIDDEFKKFSYGIGRKLFIDLFTIISINKSGTTCQIFNKLHSFDDKPAIIYPNGEKRWFHNGKCHRDNDKPAIISPNGEKRWYQYGNIYRDNDEPAVIDRYGTQKWYQNGKLHRDNDKPAVIHSKGGKEWYQHGKIHRDSPMSILPAVIQSNGIQKWYQNGKLHRDNDLPAIIDSSGLCWIIK